ncbi:MAG: alginate export family protein [Verrucomicrobiales bacterium]
MTVGRQEIALGDQRFIGTVGWRQNEQTLDAARLRFQPHSDLWIDYAYVWRVNRIFGEQAPTAALNHFERASPTW